jgi:dienelactone hydrolase
MTKVVTGIILAALAALPLEAPRAAVQTKEVEYEQGGTPLQGFLAWDDAAKGKRPGVLVVHEWWGHNQHARNQAKRLAEAGYVAFALDMYGKGKVATHPEDAQKFMEEATKDPALVAARFDAALALLKQQEKVDPKRIAAVGYCMGGTIALAMARAGRDLTAVATFHAGLKPPAEAAKKGAVKVREVLVQTGGKDPMVPQEQVKAFEREMKAAGVKEKVIVYPNAKHSFTNPDAGKAGMDALAYDADADRRSWRALVDFLKKVFRT